MDNDLWAFGVWHVGGLFWRHFGMLRIIIVGSWTTIGLLFVAGVNACEPVIKRTVCHQRKVSSSVTTGNADWTVLSHRYTLRMFAVSVFIFYVFASSYDIPSCSQLLPNTIFEHGFFLRLENCFTFFLSSIFIWIPTPSTNGRFFVYFNMFSTFSCSRFTTPTWRYFTLMVMGWEGGLSKYFKFTTGKLYINNH